MTHRRGTSAPAGRFAAALAVVMAAGFLLRVWNLGSGIPFAVGVDEPAIMTTVVRILKSGSFHPHFFVYPTGYIYVQVGAAIVTFLVGAIQHSWKVVDQVGPSDFYLWGRFVTAAIGTATLALVYRAALRWGPHAGLASAALLAVMPMHVRESHFVLTDVPMTCAVVLTLVLSLRASERPTIGAFLAAGAAAGLAAGIKYNALMALAMPLAVALALGRGGSLSRVAALLTASAACVAAFVATTPFALLDLPAFLSGFGTQAAAFTPRPLSAEASWVIYTKHLRQAFGWPASLLAAGGAILAGYRAVAGPDRVKWALLLVFPAVYFYLINGWGYMFARYALPTAPFIAIWAAAAICLARRSAGGCTGASPCPQGRRGTRGPPGGRPGRDDLRRLGARPRHPDDPGAGLDVDDEVDLARLGHPVGSPRARSAARAVQVGSGVHPWRDGTPTPSPPPASSGSCSRRTRGAPARGGRARRCRWLCRRPTRRSWRASGRPR